MNLKYNVWHRGEKYKLLWKPHDKEDGDRKGEALKFKSNAEKQSRRDVVRRVGGAKGLGQNNITFALYPLSRMWNELLFRPNRSIKEQQAH